MTWFQWERNIKHIPEAEDSFIVDVNSYQYDSYRIDDLIGQMEVIPVFIYEVLQKDALLKKMEMSAGMRKSHSMASPEGTFVNVSNHPSMLWGEKQRKAAESFGQIVDVPFPTIDPNDGEEKILKMAGELEKEILSLQPKAVMCQGEFTLSAALIAKLQKSGVSVYAACTQRDTRETVKPDGSVIKESIFEFTRFRKYCDMQD